MDLNREATRLALLGRANKRAVQHTLNEDIYDAQQGRRFVGGAYGSRKVGGKKHEEEVEMEEEVVEVPKKKAPVKKGGRRGRPKKQTQKDKEDEKLAMEVKGLKDEDMDGGAKGKKSKRAKEMGEEYGRSIADMDDEAKELMGGGFFGDFWDGFKKGFKAVVSPVSGVVKAIAPKPVGVAMDLAGLGKEEEKNEVIEEKKGGGKKRRAKAGANDKRKKRGALISKLMKEKKMTLGEASKYIKAHPKLLE